MTKLNLNLFIVQKPALRNSSKTEVDDSDKDIIINNNYNYNIIIINNNNNNNLKHVQERVLSRVRFRPISTTTYTRSQQTKP